MLYLYEKYLGRCVIIVYRRLYIIFEHLLFIYPMEFKTCSFYVIGTMCEQKNKPIVHYYMYNAE